MVDIKQAVLNAKSFVREIYAQAEEEVRDIGLEEVDRTEDGREWLITIGFTTADKTRPQTAFKKNLGEVLGGLATLTREYKVVHIDAETGEPLMMKMRQMRR